ncbi:UDP-glucose/GDP-mannose dehydrogenase family protein [Salibacterium salarium]|uniref:UDP-glucose 6-dehydrogenase n=1 Tax=Salibacterium salarium TaxID=284579 RepID=A0A428MUF6_9BACI|nr:UDP-glucose/GDP-mannose dehydrogenase family protein [Salibacterium salarium]RSL29775.1 UDP-glucose/GDP-mannose dehydrogenase family protein [Salibacterium salarium]
MKKIAVIGTGYVGLVTGVALAEVGHTVTCIDIDEEKVKQLQAGHSPIYEAGLEDMLSKNISNKRLFNTTSYEEGCRNADAIYVAVGTPENADGTADLRFVEAVVRELAEVLQEETVLVTKSTVPVGTNDWMQSLMASLTDVPVHAVSNPEFLKEGTALKDAFNGDRIVIGSDHGPAGELVEEINRPFGIPVYHTDIRSAEMIKYAANAFLATKISYINEIANLCELLGANVEDVADGMGMDPRIGRSFLNAGIGYGGSCFPKDTKALVNMADQAGHNFGILDEVVLVNRKQRLKLFEKAKHRLGSLKGKNIAVLGLSFKPNTDDMREAASLAIIEELILAGATVTAFDPIAMPNAKDILPEAIYYADSSNEALQHADAAFLLTEWDEITSLPLTDIKQLMASPILFDGRNCYDPDEAERIGIEYYSIGRQDISPAAERV